MRVKTTILAILTLLVISTIFIVVWQNKAIKKAEAQATLPPRVFYTDIISGPNTGGRNNNGAFLTISGKGFGTTMGSSIVTVGGGEVIEYISWSDTKIEVQIGPYARTGDVIVHTPDGDAHGEPFTVRSGNIYFMHLSGDDSSAGTYETPWRTFGQSRQKLSPGDFLYVRGGDYIVGPSARHIDLHSGEGGSPSSPITCVAGSATGGGALSTSSGQVALTWSIASLPAGQQGSVSFRVRVE